MHFWPRASSVQDCKKTVILNIISTKLFWTHPIIVFYESFVVYLCCSFHRARARVKAAAVTFCVHFVRVFHPWELFPWKELFLWDFTKSHNNSIVVNSLFCSVRTELVGEGAISRLAISQADVRHSGVYTCAVSDNITQSLRLHIIDGRVPIMQKSWRSWRPRYCFGWQSRPHSLAHMMAIIFLSS